MTYGKNPRSEQIWYTFVIPFCLARFQAMGAKGLNKQRRSGFKCDLNHVRAGWKISAPSGRPRRREAPARRGRGRRFQAVSKTACVRAPKGLRRTTRFGCERPAGDLARSCGNETVYRLGKGLPGGMRDSRRRRLGEDAPNRKRAAGEDLHPRSGRASLPEPIVNRETRRNQTP